MKKFTTEKSYEQKKENIMHEIQDKESIPDIIKILESEITDAKTMADKTWDDIQKALDGRVFTLDLLQDPKIKKLYDIHGWHQDYKDYINSQLHNWKMLA